jgi:2-polyprenyl-6-methoxyphenol hydroxylase-like FAD-dependent oxidoreductase
VIVGAGPAGVALARAGREVALVERNLDLARQFCCERLTSESLDALDHLSVLRLLDGVPRQARRSS